MTIESLLAELRRLEIRLWTEGDKLLFSAPPGALTDVLRERIRLHKPALVALLGGLQSRQRAGTGSAAAQHATGRAAPLSYAQSRMWFLAQLEPDSGRYNIPIALAFDGDLRVPVLEAALQRVVARHEVLRTVVAVEEDIPVQRVLPEVALRIEVSEQEPAPPGEREAQARRRLEREALRPFDLAHGPLLRALLLRLDAGRNVLLLTLHHIAGDGWSLSILNRELSICYNAMLQGRDPELPPLRHQYADYARRQREQLQGAALQRLLEYWKGRLDGLVQLDLPTDKPRSLRSGPGGGSIDFAVPQRLWMALGSLCGKHTVTPFMLLLAAFGVFLHRYTGQADIAVGTPIAGRQQHEFEELIGFFVNTLVMRVDLAGAPTFAELLRRVRDTALEAYDHQALPFEKLVEELAPARDGSRNPIFQVMFAFQNVPESPIDMDGLAVSRFPLDFGSEKFDLSLTMRTAGDGLIGRFSYSTALFEAVTVERMCACFLQLLESVAAGPGKPVHELPMLGERELHTVLIDWNATARRYGEDVCIHALFERRAAAEPERTALVCGGQRLSYAQLNARANQLAHFLREQGVGPEQLVGVCVSPSPEMVIAILGVLKAGGAYVPMDPGYPAERLAYMLEDSGASLVLADAALPCADERGSARTVRLGRDGGIFASYPRANPRPLVTGENLAYMIYTSGSTGRPKGVLIEHRSLTNLALGLRERCRFDDFGRALRNCLMASISFDASVDNWAMLAFGDELHVIAPEMRADSAAVLRYVREHRIDVLDCVPVQLALLVEDGLLSGDWIPPVITMGGEAVDAVLWSRLAREMRVAAYNLYGPTECTVEALVARLGADGPIPVIGRPLPNTCVYVLDAHGHVAPPGAAGEIHIGGAGLARGYHRRPELTADRFRMHTLPGLHAQRLYRTGDFGRFMPDGTLAFLGRRDGLVKLRGHTIELGEIEAAVAALPGILGAVALRREDDPGQPAIVAYVRADKEAAVHADVLRQQLLSQLPAYMVPSAFVVVEQFPLTPGGKIDRNALPRPDLASLGVRSRYAPPETELQRQLSAIWGSFIASESIGIDDDFFELGGHSLLATRVINRINRDCRVNLALRVLFEQPTIRRLAAAIEELAASVEAPVARTATVITAQPRIARPRKRQGD